MIQIDPIQFLIQAAALAAWVMLAAVVYSVIEKAISGFSDQETSMLTVYVLWFFMGMLGAHRIFCKHILSGMTQLLLTFVLFLASLAFGYYLLFAIPAVLWWLFDVSQISGWIRRGDAAAATVPSAN
jgi:TM2 domain-containing membrane protein YozV